MDNATKVVFLDCDGVLNSVEDFIENPSSDVSIQDSYRNNLRVNRKNVENLNKIIEATGAKIVLSSSWRVMSYEYIYVSHLQPAGLVGKMIGQTPDLNNRFTKYTPRGYEIQEWMEENYLPKNFVILDDNHDMRHLVPNLVLTDFFEGGLKEEHIQPAIDVLERVK